MKYYMIIIVLFWAITSYAQLRTPAQSPSASFTQTIGLTDVEVTYSRPSARGRTIFGDDGLLAYDDFWRVGANAATKIMFSSDLFIENQVLKKGSYTILAIPGHTGWRLNWYKYMDSDWNVYVEQAPLLSLELKVDRSIAFIETLELHFQNVTMNSATFLVEWENTRLSIALHVKEEEKISRAITRTLEKPSPFDYYKAALYLHETQSNLEQAITYIQHVTTSESALFFQVTREALILKDLKRYKEALKSAKRALRLSENAENKDFIKLNEKLIEELRS